MSLNSATTRMLRNQEVTLPALQHMEDTPSAEGMAYVHALLFGLRPWQLLTSQSTDLSAGAQHTRLGSHQLLPLSWKSRRGCHSQMANMQPRSVRHTPAAGCPQMLECVWRQRGPGEVSPHTPLSLETSTRVPFLSHLLSHWRYMQNGNLFHKISMVTCRLVLGWQQPIHILTASLMPTSQLWRLSQHVQETQAAKRFCSQPREGAGVANRGGGWGDSTDKACNFSRLCYRLVSEVDQQTGSSEYSYSIISLILSYYDLRGALT